MPFSLHRPAAARRRARARACTQMRTHARRHRRLPRVHALASSVTWGTGGLSRRFTLGAASSDCQARLWDIEQGETVRNYTGTPRPQYKGVLEHLSRYGIR